MRYDEFKKKLELIIDEVGEEKSKSIKVYTNSKSKLNPVYSVRSKVDDKLGILLAPRTADPSGEIQRLLGTISLYEFYQQIKFLIVRNQVFCFNLVLIDFDEPEVVDVRIQLDNDHNPYVEIL